jgi:nucleoside 2-deoxyribosyltransferase
MIYLASPMAATNDQNGWSRSEIKLLRNQEISEKLKKAGFDIFLPQENQQSTPEETFKKELEMIRNCEFMIILLSDTRGIYLEAGYAKGIGKKIYAVKLPETRIMSEWSNCWYDHIADDIDELITHLKVKE